MIISCTIDLRTELYHLDSLALTSKLPPLIFTVAVEEDWTTSTHSLSLTQIHTICLKPNRLCCRNVAIVFSWPTYRRSCAQCLRKHSVGPLCYRRGLLWNWKGVERDGISERVWSHTHHFIFMLFYIMHGGQRICQPCKGKNQVKQRCFTLSLTSVRYSFALEYILQPNIGLIPFRSSGLLQSGMKWNKQARLLKTYQAAASAQQTLPRTSGKTW